MPQATIIRKAPTTKSALTRFLESSRGHEVGAIASLRDTKTGEVTPTTWRQTGAYWMMGVAPIDKAGVEDIYPDEVEDAPYEKPVYRIYRPVEVFEKYMGTFESVPLFDQHPPMNEIMIGTDSKQPVAGTTTNAYVDHPYLVCVPILWKPSLYDIIRSGEQCEMSIGALMSYEWIAGRTEKGEDYDCVLTELFGLHVAIVPEGRAGHDVKISRVRRENLNREGFGIMAIEKKDNRANAKSSRESEADEMRDDEEMKAKRADDSKDESEAKAKRDDDSDTKREGDSDGETEQKKSKREDDGETESERMDDSETKAKREDDDKGESEMTKAQRAAIRSMLNDAVAPLAKEIASLKKENETMRAARDKIIHAEKFGSLVQRSAAILATPAKIENEEALLKAIQLRSGNPDIKNLRDAEVVIATAERFSRGSPTSRNLVSDSDASISVDALSDFSNTEDK